MVRLAAIVAGGLVALSFLMFAVDQSQEGSDSQVRVVDGQGVRETKFDKAIDAPAPVPAVERQREQANTSFRERVDDANDVLVSPFLFVDSSNVWVERLISAFLGVLVWGLGGMLLANFIPKHRTQTRDWREVTP